MESICFEIENFFRFLINFRRCRIDMANIWLKWFVSRTHCLSRCAQGSLVPVLPCRRAVNYIQLNKLVNKSVCCAVLQFASVHYGILWMKIKRQRQNSLTLFTLFLFQSLLFAFAGWQLVNLCEKPYGFVLIICCCAPDVTKTKQKSCVSSPASQKQKKRALLWKSARSEMCTHLGFIEQSASHKIDSASCKCVRYKMVICTMHFHY